MTESVTINFRPLEEQTLSLLMAVFEQEGEEPGAAYSRLVTAAALAGAFLGISSDDMGEHFRLFGSAAYKAVEGRPDIFGGPSANDD